MDLECGNFVFFSCTVCDWIVASNSICIICVSVFFLVDLELQKFTDFYCSVPTYNFCLC